MTSRRIKVIATFLFVMCAFVFFSTATVAAKGAEPPTIPTGWDAYPPATILIGIDVNQVLKK